MTLDHRLLALLVCPLCKGPLVFRKSARELICKADRLAYPIRDDIPVMLIDEGDKWVSTAQDALPVPPPAK